MKQSLLVRSLFAAACAALVASSASAQLINGGFETGNFSGWNLSDPDGFANVGTNPAFSYNSNDHANLGTLGTEGTLSQTFNTAAGTTYHLSFWLTCDSGVTPNSFNVFWGGAQVLSVVNSAAFDYTNYTFDLLAPGNTTTLEFRFRHDDDYWRLDEVTADAVPEASTISMASFGLGLLILLAYHRRKSGRAF